MVGVEVGIESDGVHIDHIDVEIVIVVVVAHGTKTEGQDKSGIQV